jgi:hypothetical protein
VTVRNVAAPPLPLGPVASASAPDDEVKVEGSTVTTAPGEAGASFEDNIADWTKPTLACVRADSPPDVGAEGARLSGMSAPLASAARSCDERGVNALAEKIPPAEEGRCCRGM